MEPEAVRSAVPATGARSRSVAGGPRRWLARVPVAAWGLVVLFGALVAFLVTQARAYGRTYDEVLQQDYGKRVLAWYLSAGHDRGFLQYPSYYQMPQHGPFAETVIAATQRLTGEDWTTRSVVTGIFAILGVLAVALCGYELGGWWVALLSAVGLSLYPRYLGAMFNNSKDVPFAAAMAFVLWTVLRLMRRWDGPFRTRMWGSAGVGVAIGAAASIRVVGVIWFPLLGLLAAGWWLRHPSAVRDRAVGLANLGDQIVAGVVTGVASLVTMCALWPYVTIDPIPHLVESIASMSKYPWGGTIPFDGRMYSAQDLPRRYVLEWLLIGSPVPVVVLGALGVALAVVQLARVRTGVRWGVLGSAQDRLRLRSPGVRWGCSPSPKTGSGCAPPVERWGVLGSAQDRLRLRSPGDPRLALVVLSFGVPVAVLAVLRSTMYNGLRQFLFVVPALVLLASHALIWLWHWLERVSARAAVQSVLTVTAAVLVAGGQAQAIGEMVRLHPYEYVYFSPLVGGFDAATRRYELDYWGVCNKPAAEWLARNVDRFRPPADGRPLTVTGAGLDPQFMLYLPPGRFVAGGDGADVYFWSMRERTPDPYPTYTTVHVEWIEGYPACMVKVRPGI